jgi:hypothetical protein
MFSMEERPNVSAMLLERLVVRCVVVLSSPYMSVDSLTPATISAEASNAS